MRGRRLAAVSLVALLVAATSVQPGELVGQSVGGGSTGVEVTVAKPLMGPNYDALTGMLGVEARLARGPASGLILHGVMIHSTSGRATSTTLANPTVGMWMRPGGIPLEVEVSVPLMRELGDDDFATDVARLSDQQHRERYVRDRWAVSAAWTPSLVFRDGSSGGAYLGSIALLPHADRDLDLRARYEAWVNLRFSPRLHGGARLAGTLRVNGSGGFDQRTQQDLSMLLTFPSMPGFPELSFRLPVDIDLQDYVTGVVALRLRF